MDDLRLTVDRLKPGIVMITETWLSDTVIDSYVGINNFHLFRCDRSNRIGGGVCIWVNDNISSSLHLPTGVPPSSCEIVFTKLFCASRVILCCVIYVPPGLCKDVHQHISDFLVNEFDALLSANPHSNIIIAGDFNDFSCAIFEEELALSGKVNIPTRGDAILDKIFIDSDFSTVFDEYATIGPPIDNSDHCSILLRSTLHMRDASSRCIPVWDFRSSNLDEFVFRLSTVDFTAIESTVSVDAMCDMFYQLLHSCLSAIPYEMVTLTSRDKPWLTPLLKLLIDKRWAAFRDRNWTMYHHYKCKVKEEVIKAKKQWADKHRQNTHGMWKILREVKRSPVSDSFQHILQGDFNDDVNRLLAAFTDVFKSNFNDSPDADLSDLNASSDCWMPYISEHDVLHELLHIDSRKGCGPDLIPSRVLVAGADFLCSPLCKIFNRSIETATFPKLFKCAFIQPIPKKSRPTVKDFRPISMTPVLGKIFERIVLRSVKQDLISLYGLNQHAYRPFGSTTSALFAIQDRVSLFMDMKSTVAVRVACLDISKAFDCLQFHRLLNFLNDSGFNHSFLRWLKSYLSDRRFRVRIRGCEGQAVWSLSGVPQGSVLGPFLFASFMGSINFDSEHVSCIKYADDITIIERLVSPAQQSLSIDVISETFANAGLFLNLSKCQEIVIQRSFLPENIVSTSIFQRVCVLRVLGMIISDTLCWKPQICDILKRVSQRLFIIRCLKDVLSTKELITVYHAIITSMMLYASPTYGNLPKQLQLKLERFQRRAHRLICRRDCDCHRFPAISVLLRDRGLRYLESCEKLKSHPLHHFVPKRLENSNQLILSHSSTSRRLHSFFPWFCAVANGNFIS